MYKLSEKRAFMVKAYETMMKCMKTGLLQHRVSMHSIEKSSAIGKAQMIEENIFGETEVPSPGRHKYHCCCDNKKITSKYWFQSSDKWNSSIYFGQR